MVSVARYQSDELHRKDLPFGAAPIGAGPIGAQDAVDYSDSQSSTSESSSDDGSSQDSVSSASSVSSISLEFSTSLSRFNSSECYETATSQHVAHTRAEPVPNWLETVNNATPAKVLPIEQRQNPRRTAPTSAAPVEVRQPPCSLIRQSERKDCFVAILVGFAAQFVEAIWPLAACTPRTDTCFFGRGVLPLRTFITETLRRSRTSYSTLQVALFYLVLIKDFIPKTNFCMEQPRGSDEFRSMQCGRRMFLTALILASKYLQDRNYSTRAWSKISGLRAQEIHVNEMNYCKIINWNLHIPQEKFQRWSRIVLRLSAPTMGPGSETLAQRIGWPIVLDKLDGQLSETFENLEGLPKPCPGLTALPLNANFCFGDNPTKERGLEQFKAVYNSESSTGEAPQPAAQYSTPSPSIASQPPLPRILNLPTPQSTPQTNPCGNFAVALGTPAMSAAMSQVRNSCLMRATLDVCPPPQGCPARFDEKRRSSLSQSSTSVASPESVASDVPTVYSRASRSSSISSMASSVSASSMPAKLDRLAVQRAAGLRDNRTPPSEASLSRMLATNAARSTSPESYMPAPHGANSDLVSNVQAWSSGLSGDKMDYRLQELEVAAALCKLRPMAAPSMGLQAQNTPKPTGSQYSVESPSSWQSTPNAAQLNNINYEAQARARARKDSVSPTSHKRTHSKTTSDVLQDQVRAQLRQNLWSSEMPDRTSKASPSFRDISPQSPTLTYGITKTAVPVRGTDGHKRHCVYEVSAADRTARMLRADLVNPIR